MTEFNVLLISIDSLRCDVLDAYRDEPRGFGYPVDTPNLDRFADRAAVFETHYAGSLPCMPARREWYTGIQEFLWRPWGPIEPFDDPLPRQAREAGAVAQLITDHFHYFQHGSHGYYEDFNGYEFFRGHELDPWQTTPIETDEGFTRQIEAGDPRNLSLLNRTVYARNRERFSKEEDWFAPKVFSKAAEWLRENGEWNQWLCYVDSFDVHEPFDVPEPYASMYTDEDPRDPDLPVWPKYGRITDNASEAKDHESTNDDDPTDVDELHPERSHDVTVAYTDRQVDFVRSQFAGKVTMVDRWFGQVLDTLTQEGYWEDTVVVVTSDHGHFLGDHGYMGKPYAPLYDTLAKTPLLIWHPESERMGETISALTSAVDLYATILEVLGRPVPDSVHSRSLLPILEDDRQSVREWALYGYWGSSVNVTDGRFTYLHPTRSDSQATLYSTMVLNPYPDGFYPPQPDPTAEADQFLPYTDAPVWRTEGDTHGRHDSPMLFDRKHDPGQTENIAGQSRPAETRMRSLLTGALDALDSPPEVYDRLGLRRS